MDLPMNWFCYGIGHGEKCRIGNRLSLGLKLGKDDKKIVKAIGRPGDPGEHISAMVVALPFMMEFDHDLNVQAAVDLLAETYRRGAPIGYAINEARMTVVAYLRRLRANNSEEIERLVFLLEEQAYIVIDLDRQITGEGDKP